MTNKKDDASYKIDIANICIGENLRKKRISAGVSAEEMSKILKISLRLYHKYERGLTEIPHNILWCIAMILNVDINHFFEELPKWEQLDFLKEEKVRKLLWHFQRIPDQETTINLSKLIKELSAA